MLIGIKVKASVLCPSCNARTQLPTQVDFPPSTTRLIFSPLPCVFFLKPGLKSAKM